MLPRIKVGLCHWGRWGEWIRRHLACLSQPLMLPSLLIHWSLLSGYRHFAVNVVWNMWQKLTFWDFNKSNLRGTPILRSLNFIYKPYPLLVWKTRFHYTNRDLIIIQLQVFTLGLLETHSTSLKVQSLVWCPNPICFGKDFQCTLLKILW